MTLEAATSSVRGCQGPRALHGEGAQEACKQRRLRGNDSCGSKRAWTTAILGVDEEDNMVMMSFGSISFFPESFARFTLTRFGNDEFGALPETLGWSGPSNMVAMVEITANLGITGDPSFGLNEYGKPRTVKKGKEERDFDGV